LAGIGSTGIFPAPYGRSSRSLRSKIPAKPFGLIRPASVSERCAAEAAMGGFDQQKETTMSNIGTFTRENDGFVGTIATLTVKTKATIRPVEKTSDQAPDFRVNAGNVEIGAGWSATSKGKKDYVSIKLDDPSFPAPIYCRLVGLADEQQALVWSR
jgi:uncharacterized protein (DUF736 family)